MKQLLRDGQLQEGTYFYAGRRGEYPGCAGDWNQIRAENCSDFFYLSNEGISLLENAGHLGLPIPERLKVVLKQLHDKSEDKGDE